MESLCQVSFGGLWWDETAPTWACGLQAGGGALRKGRREQAKAGIELEIWDWAGKESSLHKMNMII